MREKTNRKTKTEIEVAAQPKQAAEPYRVLFVAAEAYPFAATGGLGDVVGSLPAALNRGGKADARVFLPLYGSIKDEDRKNFEFVCSLYVPVSWRNQYCGIFRTVRDGVTYYFADNEYYFKRPNLYGYYDDGERFAFFARAALEFLPHIGWTPQALHCHDWHAALTPVYYKLFYAMNPFYRGIKTIFTIHNIEYQGKFAENIIEDVFGIPHREYPSLEFDGCINLMKAAIEYSDRISTVSPTYAEELSYAFYAHGLENVISSRRGALRGILNGIDTELYDPRTDGALFVNYGADEPEKKRENKTALQQMLDLPVRENVPLIAVISRFVTHKGLDLIRFVLGDLLKNDVQVVLLGKGDRYYEEYFLHMRQTCPDKVCTVIAYNKDLAQKIYAAADIFLMPSKSEPCGLSQMIACRYGAIPVVRATGGLKDSIKDYGDGGIGFTFQDYSADAFLPAILRAIALYGDREGFENLAKKAMTADFSWDRSAESYVEMYLD